MSSTERPLSFEHVPFLLVIDICSYRSHVGCLTVSCTLSLTYALVFFGTEAPTFSPLGGDTASANRGMEAHLSSLLLTLYAPVAGV